MNKYILETELAEPLQQKIIDCVRRHKFSNWSSYTRIQEGADTATESPLIDRGRRHSYVFLYPEISNEVHEFSNSVIDSLKLDTEFIRPIPDVKIDDMQFLPHMISVVYKEKKKSIGIYPHVDNRSADGWYHLRFNFLVSSAEGGDPVVESTVLDVKEKQGWICFASEWNHGTLPVTNDEYRIALSLGYFIEPEYARKTFKNLLTNLNNNV